MVMNYKYTHEITAENAELEDSCHRRVYTIERHPTNGDLKIRSVFGQPRDGDEICIPRKLLRQLLDLQEKGC